MAVNGDYDTLSGLLSNSAYAPYFSGQSITTTPGSLPAMGSYTDSSMGDENTYYSTPSATTYSLGLNSGYQLINPIADDGYGYALPSAITPQQQVNDPSQLVNIPGYGYVTPTSNYNDAYANQYAENQSTSAAQSAQNDQVIGANYLSQVEQNDSNGPNSGIGSFLAEAAPMLIAPALGGAFSSAAAPASYLADGSSAAGILGDTASTAGALGATAASTLPDSYFSDLAQAGTADSPVFDTSGLASDSTGLGAGLSGSGITSDAVFGTGAASSVDPDISDLISSLTNGINSGASTLGNTLTSGDTDLSSLLNNLGSSGINTTNSGLFDLSDSANSQSLLSQLGLSNSDLVQLGAKGLGAILTNSNQSQLANQLNSIGQQAIAAGKNPFQAASVPAAAQTLAAIQSGNISSIPFIQAMNNSATQAFQGAYAKSGNPYYNAVTGSAQLQAAQSSYLNNYLQTLFQTGTPNSGLNAGTQAQTVAAIDQANAPALTNFFLGQIGGNSNLANAVANGGSSFLDTLSNFNL